SLQLSAVHTVASEVAWADGPSGRRVENANEVDGETDLGNGRVVDPDRDPGPCGGAHREPCGRDRAASEPRRDRSRGRVARRSFRALQRVLGDPAAGERRPDASRPMDSESE